MNEQKNSFIGLILGSIISPIETLQSIQERELQKSVAIVIMITLVAAVASYNYAGKLSMPIQININFVRTLFAVQSGLGSIVNWLIPTLIIHLIAYVLKGNGELKRFLTLTGFSSIPKFFQQVLRLVDALIISNKQLMGIITPRNELIGFQNKFINNSIGWLNVFSIWSMILIMFSLKNNYNLGTEKAVIAILLTFLIITLIWSLLPF